MIFSIIKYFYSVFRVSFQRIDQYNLEPSNRIQGSFNTPCPMKIVEYEKYILRENFTSTVRNRRKKKEDKNGIIIVLVILPKWFRYTQVSVYNYFLLNFPLFFCSSKTRSSDLIPDHYMNLFIAIARGVRNTYFRSPTTITPDCGP